MKQIHRQAMLAMTGLMMGPRLKGPLAMALWLTSPIKMGMPSVRRRDNSSSHAPWHSSGVVNSFSFNDQHACRSGLDVVGTATGSGCRQAGGHAGAHS